MEWGNYGMISIKRGLEDFNELNTIIRGVNDINVLVKLIQGNPDYIIANDLREENDMIDVNYKSICVTIKQEKNYLTLLPDVECWDKFNYITVNLWQYRRYNITTSEDGLLHIRKISPYDEQEYYYAIDNAIYRDGKFIERVEDDDYIDSVDNIILRLIELNKPLKPLIDKS